MSLFRRFKLYFLGVFLGLTLVYFFFKDRALPTWLPKSVILKKLQNNPLIYTKHANCRMNCRQISRTEVQQILETGKVVFNKSRVHDKPCPTYALEGVTDDGQTVRIVFAACDSTTKVVTAIDLTAVRQVLKRTSNCDCE